MTGLATSTLGTVLRRIKRLLTKQCLLPSPLLPVARRLHLMSPVIHCETSLRLRTHVASLCLLWCLWCSIFLLSCCNGSRRCWPSMWIGYHHVASYKLTMTGGCLMPIVAWNSTLSILIMQRGTRCLENKANVTSSMIFCC